MAIVLRRFAVTHACRNLTFGTSGGPTLASAGTLVRVSGALLLGLGERFGLDKNALPLIAPSRPSEAHHDCRALAVLGGAPRHRGIARLEILQVRHSGARQAQRLLA